MIFMVSAMFAALLSIALLHAAWAFGMVWPAKDAQGLVDTVIGSPGLTKMPGRALTLMVAGSIAASGICALWSAGMIALPLPDWIRTAAAPVLCLIFGLRGMITYAAGSKWSRNEPFASLDRRVYAPLCLSIALGFAVIMIRN